MTDPSSIPLSTRPRPLWAWLAVLSLVLGGCTGPGLVPGDDVLSEARLAEDQVPAVGASGSRQDVLYKLLVAEFAGHRGQLPLAVENYLQVARETSDPDIAERAVRIAVFARDNDAALKAARLWSQLVPESVDARRVLVVLNLRTGHLEEASAQLETLIEGWKGEQERAYSALVSLLAREPDKTAALDLLERHARAHPDEPLAALAYANLAVRANDLDRARKVLAGLLARQPGETRATLLYVRVLQAQGDDEAALRQMAKLLEANPQNTAIRTTYARMLVSAKRYDDALAEFRRLAEMVPDNADVRFALGLLLLQTKRVDAAEQQFKRLLKLRKRVLTAHYYLGQILESRSQGRKAIGHYRKVDRGQHYLDAQVRVAVLMAKAGRLNDAREHLHGINAHNIQEGVRVYLAETELLTDAGKQAEAMATYDRALEEYPRNTDLLYARAMLGEKMGKLDVLERDLRDILSREPNNAQTLNALGYTLADRSDRYQEAYELIKRALEQRPDDYYILDSMGWVLYRLGRYQEAVGYLQRAANASDDVEIATHLGEVLWVMGRKEDARDVWGHALKNTPGDERLLRVMKRFMP